MITQAGWEAKDIKKTKLLLKQHFNDHCFVKFMPTTSSSCSKYENCDQRAK